MSVEDASSPLLGHSLGSESHTKEYKLEFLARRWFWTPSLWVGITNGLTIGNIAAVITNDHFNDEVPRSDTVTEFLVAMMQVGAVIGSLIIGGELADRYGRRISLTVSSLLFLAGALLTGSFAWIPTLFIGRFLSGLGMGISCQTMPVYLTELSPASLRGILDSSFQLFINVGIMGAYLLNIGVLPSSGGDNEWGWRISLMSPAVPALFGVLVMWILPESPRWYILKGRETEAREALLGVRDTVQEVDEEILAMQNAIESDKRAVTHSQDSSASTVNTQTDATGTWAELISPHHRKSFMIGVSVLVFQVLTGIDIFTAYSPNILENSGFEEDSNQLVGATVAVGVIFPVATFAALFVVERVGRRTLLLGGSAGMTLSMATLAILQQFDFHQSTSGQYAVLAAILSYIAFFSFSWGPISWCIPAEVFSLTIRAKAMSFGVFANWIADAIVVATFLSLVSGIGYAGALWFYVVIGVICFLFTYAYVPETKGKELEAVEDLSKPRRDEAIPIGVS